MIKQAVIFAGGQGIRLRPYTLTTPKPMIPFYGKPFLEYTIQELKSNGIEEIILLVGYLHEKIEEYFKDGSKFGVSIIYSYSPLEADTGTRLRNARHLFKRHILLLYGDNYWPLELKQLRKFYKKMNLPASITGYSNHDRSTTNNLRIGTNGIVELYDRKRKEKNVNAVDIGFFIIDKKILMSLPTGNFSFEDIIIQKLVHSKQLAGYLTHHKYYGLSNLERIPIIENFFKPKKIVFLDRDGVINKKAEKAKYITKWEEFIFLPKVKEALKILKQKGYDIYIITNQAGVSRRIVTVEQIKTIHQRMIEELQKYHISINGIYMCTHGWDEGCFCRKPKPGLLFKAASENHINLFESHFIGDDLRDVKAGKAANTKTYLVNSKKNLFHIASNYL